MRSLEKKLHHKNIENISFNPDNPRGEQPHQIMGDKEFGKLVSSIGQYGLLEPLIVKKDIKKKDHYILIDGERRLRAANKVAKAGEIKSTVPVLIAKDEVDGRILAYQVHMLRKNWIKVSETKAIKQIIDDIKEKSPSISDANVKKELKNITAHRDHDLNAILTLIKYDDDIIGKVLSKDLDMSYLVQIESSFMTPLRRKYPSVIEKYDENTIRHIMANKAINRLLKNTRFLTDKFREVFNKKDHEKQIEKLLLDFMEDKNKNIQEAYDEFDKLGRLGGSKTKKPATTKKRGGKGSSTRKAKSVSHYKEIKTTIKQQTSLEDIHKKIESIAKVFSSEEYAYITEGCDCLKNHCFKAAVLMLWATAISRVLSVLDKDIDEFNRSSSEMKAKPKSEWKHSATHFKMDYNDVEEIRVQSNDIHLLCYLCYKKIITVTQCKKLKSIYGTRNDCGHPTDVEISPNEVIAAFENVYSLILNNKELK